jgi:hypothetical protein
LNHIALALFAQRARIPTSLPEALAFVPFGFVLVRVRVPRSFIELFGTSAAHIPHLDPFGKRSFITLTNS